MFVLRAFNEFKIVVQIISFWGKWPCLFPVYSTQIECYLSSQKQIPLTLKYSLKNKVEIHFKVNNQFYPAASISTFWQHSIPSMFQAFIGMCIYFDSFRF